MKTIILGAGMTGLAAGFKTGAPIFESSDKPGGICRTIRAKGYMFEKGGGHWMFGVSDNVVKFLDNFGITLKKYKKRSGVYYNCIYKGSIQDHSPKYIPQENGSMKDLLYFRFGNGLCNMFFFPFNEMYTNGLYNSVIPENEYKSPIRKSDEYNTNFYYPDCGLDSMADSIAKNCEVYYNKNVIQIITGLKKIHFDDGSFADYDRIISTIPLNRLLEITCCDNEMYPYVSTLVINIGGKKGRNFPNKHWLYVPHSESGFHRIGFYSNVDTMFAPKDRCSIYVEMSCAQIEKNPSFINTKAVSVVHELTNAGIIESADVVEADWIDVSYTYRYKKTDLKKDLEILAAQDIHSIGRYGAWHFQGIADSIEEGLKVEL